MISIVIPSYNQQAYLADAIESCLNQTRQPDQIIVVNDGSTDNSLEIAKRFPVKIIDQTNRGLASARNTGILNSFESTNWDMNPDLDWLLPLDADDMLLPTAVARIEQEILKHPEADIISPSFKTFGTSNQEVILMENPSLEDFRTGNKIPYCSAIRKSKLIEVGGYSPRMVEGYEDLHLWLTLLSRGSKIVTIPEVLWLYRTKEKSMWTEIANNPEIHKKLLAQINKDVPEAKLNY